MRLICPNCGAQYEVGDDVIPQEGRDVQCSNCSHTWFEQPSVSVAAEFGGSADASDVEPARAAEPAPKPDPDPAPDLEQDLAAEIAPHEAPEPSRDPAPTPAGSQTESEPQAEPQPKPQPAPARGREMAPDVADILRQEAAYEEAARKSEAQALETQPDLDLSRDPIPQDQPAPAPVAEQTPDTTENDRSRATRERLARLRGEEAPVDTVGGTAVDAAAALASAGVTAGGAAVIQQADTTPRRDLLPDIEEINSTLRQDTTAYTTPFDTDEPEPSSRFARGFMLSLVIALIGLVAYVFAPQIGAAVPATDPLLLSYVEWVNGVRLWLDAQLQTMAQAFAPELVD